MTLNLYYDLPKYLKLKVLDLCSPKLKVCGVHQYISGEEGNWTVMWFFDEIEFYCVNVHFSRTRKNVYIKGFRNRRQPDVNEQLKFFVNQLTSVEGATVELMKESRHHIVYPPFGSFDDSVRGMMSWLPGAVLEYIKSVEETDGNTTLECEHDPEYFKHVKDGITNRQYDFMFGKCILQYYKIPFEINPITTVNL